MGFPLEEVPPLSRIRCVTHRCAEHLQAVLLPGAARQAASHGPAPLQLSSVPVALTLSLWSLQAEASADTCTVALRAALL